ncbi:Ig-like domain-containing protein [Pseudophaeobacter sp.]|uniref:beta strand repeat-containing protein n=1 Tax=Pseudophaeobacter sp. TaxID=1971739 RepID=UPI003296F4C6
MTDLLRRFSHLLVAGFLLVLPGLAQAQAAPSFTALFSPDSITAGGESSLTFTIDNSSGPTGASDLAFSATLPTGVTIADGSQSNSCTNSSLTAVSGSASITVSDGRLGAGQICMISLPVTSSTVTTHSLTTGDLTSSLGNSSTATDDLVVNASAYNFLASVSPGAVDPGSTATLSYSFDVVIPASPVFADWRTTDLNMTLPTGLEFTNPFDGTTTAGCSGVLTADTDSGVLSFDGTPLNAEGTYSCTITAVITGDTPADHVVSSTLTVAEGFGSPVTTETKVVDFTVNTPPADGLGFVKSFDVSQASAGASVTLNFALSNTSRTATATNISFSDDLNAMLAGLAATALPADGFCGPGSSLSGSSTLTLSGATLAAEASCDFDVTLLVPAAAASGVYTNSTSAISADLDGSPYTGRVASTTLRVLGDGGLAPQFSKAFVASPTAPGGIATLRYTITNPNSAQTLSAMAFTDGISAITGSNGVSMNTLPSPGDCGAGSTFSLAVPNLDEFELSVTGANLTAGSSCTFDLLLNVDAAVPPGSYPFSSSTLTASVGGSTVSALPASATLQVEGGANLTFVKVFSEDLVGAGGTATLTYTLTSAAESPATATGLGFSDDLDGFLTGTTLGITSNGCGGSAGLFAGNSRLDYTLGSLDPGASCSIVTTVSIPGGAANGTYTSTTSTPLTGTAGGEALSVPAASDSLQVLTAQPLVSSHSLSPSSALPGETVTLTYTLTNPDPSAAYTAGFFTENYSAALSGLAASALPAGGFCGGGSAASGTTFGTFTGLEIPASDSCSFSVDLLVPAGASDGSYQLLSSSVSATVGGNPVALPAMTETLLVDSALVQLVKSYSSDPTAPGGTVTVNYTLTNLNSTKALANLAFSDDLDGLLTGLASTSGSQSNICGAGSGLTGTGTLGFTSGSLAAGASCSFSASLAVPGGASANIYSSSTSAVSGDAAGLTISGPAATTSLTISAFELPSFTKSFTPAAMAPAGSSTLTYVITNTDSSTSLSGLRFSDDLDSALSGMVVSGGTGSNLCGAGSTVSGSGQISLENGLLAASESCTITLTVTAPAAATPGSYTSTTSTLTANGTFAANAASAGFSVEPPPGFAQAVSPATINQGGTSTATFTIDNTSSALAASSLDFSNSLPAGLIIATPPNLAVTCSGGSATAVAGSSTLTYTGGTAPAGASCSVAVDLKATVGGTYVNTSGNLTSSLGLSSTAVATLVATATSVSLDQDPIGLANQSAVSFTFANAEVGASYSYSLTSSGGGSAVTGSGSISSTTETVSGLDLSGLGDGTIGLAVTVTGSQGHVAPVITDSASKTTSRPSATLAGPAAAQSSAFAVTLSFSASVTGLAEADFTIDNGTASGLSGSGASYSVTVTPDHDGTVTISLPADSATDGGGNGNQVSNSLTVEADLTGTPDPSPPADTDGDGVADNLESSSADRDGDGIVDSADYDPQGYFYCEDDGRILSGGGITVTGPSGSNSSVGISNNINIVRDGSTGEYQWFALVPGTYSVAYSYPSSGVASTARLTSGSLDVTTLLPANPAVLGSTQVGSTGLLADTSLAANPVFYDTFVIEAGDPHVLANNIPMTSCQVFKEISASTSDTGAEANGAATDGITVTISQTLVSGQDSVISYTMSGTATSGVDYTAPSGSVTIPAGSTSVTVDLPVLEDGLIEGSETVILTLTALTSGATDVRLSTTPANLIASSTLFDDDSASVAVSNDDLTASEGGSDTAAMSFRLLGQPGQNVVLTFAGDAQCNVSPAVLTFTSVNYASSQSLTITAIEDNIAEGSHSCQPTVTVSSADLAYDAFALTLAQVSVSDDLIAQIRAPLTAVLKNDLEQTVVAQQRYFSGIAKGALSRLQEGEDGLGCGALASFDVDGSIQTQGGTGQSKGNFGYDVYNCATGSRNILSGSFSLSRTENIGTQGLVQFANQRERFLSERDLRGKFWGGYLTRTNVTGLADGHINGIGVNAGLYGARRLGAGLFLDYYAAGGFGHHRFDLNFATGSGAIQADGSYEYAAAYAGVALSGEHKLESMVITPRIGLDLAYALVGDADVTARQLGHVNTGSIDLPNYDGGRLFAEVEFAGLASEDPRGISSRIAVTPRLICEVSSYDSDLDCGLGLGFSHELFNPMTGLSFSFEIDYEKVDATDRLSLDLHRERRFANDQGAVVTRLSMPQSDTDSLTLEHGLRLDF